MLSPEYIKGLYHKLWQKNRGHLPASQAGGDNRKYKMEICGNTVDIHGNT